MLLQLEFSSGCRKFSGIKGYRLHFSPPEFHSKCPGFTPGYPQQLFYSCNICFFSFPEVFVHAHAHVLGMINKNLETSLLAEHQIPKTCINFKVEYSHSPYFGLQYK